MREQSQHPWIHACVVMLRVHADERIPLSPLRRPRSIGRRAIRGAGGDVGITSGIEFDVPTGVRQREEFVAARDRLRITG